MTEVDIGDIAPSVFTRLEYNVTGRPVAAFVSRYGEAFCLTGTEVELRIHYLTVQGREVVEERRAMKALRSVGG